MGSNTNRISSADFAEAMRLLGIEPDNPDRALVEVRIHEGCIDATYAQVRPLNIEYTSTRARLAAPEPTADEEMEAFDQFEQAVERLSPNAQKHINAPITYTGDPAQSDAARKALEDLL
ncbi:hypothetical protein [Nocardia nova]|uniref:hypothetical protein n=1 Tax=Nocardia nova TaxID=37330 RepID=UPI0018959DEF|nr:hypothetical protein [Nocardia nova]MBF6277022.1 hypothetical protein [Nocardia nova]